MRRCDYSNTMKMQFRNVLVQRINVQALRTIDAGKQCVDRSVLHDCIV